MLRGLIVSGVAVFSLVLFMDANSQGGDKKAPASIKVIMQKAMKGGLANKVVSGKATADEKKLLISLFTDLTTHKAPAGDDAAFKERTAALLKAAKEDDGKALKTAMTCKTCHDNYKK